MFVSASTQIKETTVRGLKSVLGSTFSEDLRFRVVGDDDDN
jgi:hypothetical protein